MIFVTCKSCGALVKLENANDNVICEYCNTLCAIEETTQTNKSVINNRTIANSNAAGTNYVEERLRTAETLIEMGEIGRANRIYSGLIDVAPDNYKVWMGMFFCDPDRYDAYKNFKRGIQLCNDDNIKASYYEKYRLLRRGTFREVMEYESEYGSRKGDSLGEYFNKKLEELCNTKWKMALRHKYLYIAETLFDSKHIEINTGKNMIDGFYFHRYSNTRFNRLEIRGFYNNTCQVCAKRGRYESELVYPALKKTISSQEDVDEIIKELSEYPVINEEKEYSEEREDCVEDMLEVGFTLLGKLLGL